MRFLAPIAGMALLLARPLVAELPPSSRFSVENMDPEVKPGTDFYKYANGGWIKRNSIPDDQVTWSPTTEITERNLALLRELLLQCASSRSDRPPQERLVGDFFAAATDDERLEQLGATPLNPFLEKIGAVRAKGELPALLAELHESGFGGLFSAAVSADARKSDVYAFELSQGGLGLPDRDYYVGKQFAKERAAYRVHMQKLNHLLLTQTDDADLNAVLSIEEALARGSRKLEDCTDPVANYHKLTLAELQKLTPSFAWKTYLEAAHAAPLESLVVGQPEFFKALEAALKKYSVEDWKSYLRWHLLIGASPLLHEAAAQESFAFHGTVLSGQPKIDPRWKRAIRRVDSALGEALGQIYTDRYFPAEAKTRMRELVENVETVFRERLQKVPWMSPATRQQAVKKFSKFTAKIGAPENPRDYSAIAIKRDDYFGNVVRANAWESRREMARIGKPVDRTEWEMTAPTVNAYFNPSLNEIVFPAGILQPPFFDVTIDDAVNYGATAATIGHEMTHGYDSEGRKYDAEGNLRDWWTKSDAREFDSRAQRLVQQFSVYESLPGAHVNGKLTLAENIADLGGLSIAYEALQRALGDDPEKRKPIDGLTPEQRFFISYAQSWASLARPEYLRQALTTDVHAPEAIRGFAPLLNLQEFFDAFDIKPEDPLWRPKNKRAVIW